MGGHGYWSNGNKRRGMLIMALQILKALNFEEAFKIVTKKNALSSMISDEQKEFLKGLAS